MCFLSEEKIQEWLKEHFDGWIDYDHWMINGFIAANPRFYKRYKNGAYHATSINGPITQETLDELLPLLKFWAEKVKIEISNRENQ